MRKFAIAAFAGLMVSGLFTGSALAQGHGHPHVGNGTPHMQSNFRGGPSHFRGTRFGGINRGYARNYRNGRHYAGGIYYSNGDDYDTCAAYPFWHHRHRTVVQDLLGGVLGGC